MRIPGGNMPSSRARSPPPSEIKIKPGQSPGTERDDEDMSGMFRGGARLHHGAPHELRARRPRTLGLIGQLAPPVGERRKAERRGKRGRPPGSAPPLERRSSVAIEQV